MYPRRVAQPSIRFVLVEPRSSGNIGAAARALKNCGFDRLVLVAPACDPLDEEARRFAVDAKDVLLAAERVPSLDAALEGAATVVGTSGLAGKQRRPNWRLDAFAAGLSREAAKGPLAFVFGRESRGLTDDELDRCTHLVHLAASEAYTSFNLAQALLLCAYTTRLALGVEPQPAAHDEPAAVHEEREAMYAHLNEALRAIGFLKPEQEEGMARRLRRMFGRADFTSGDVKVLRGIARQILWIARR
jgi:TrmH family RNA methyltransferase